MVNKKETISKESKGYIEDYYAYHQNTKNKKDFNFGTEPKFNLKKALETIRKDSTVVSAITTLVDKTIEKGWRVKNAKTTETLKKLRFDRLLRQILFNIYTYNNVFIENVKNENGNIKELHVLETTLIEPVTNEHGQVYYYKQQVLGEENGDGPTWDVDEVTHIASTKVSTNIWGEVDIQSVYKQVLIKQYIERFLGWLYGTNQFRPFYNIKDANPEQVKEFLAYLRKSENDINFPLIAEGEIEAKVLRGFEDGKDILEIWEKCDRDIMTLLQVSPIHMGQPDNSNRSNSEEQGRSDNIRVKSCQKLIEESINYDLFPKIGLKDDSFIFNEIETKELEKVLEMIERMKNIGFKRDVVEEYLKMNNFPIQNKTLIDKKMYEGNQEKSEDMFASRKRKPEGELSNRIGTGSEGTSREEQIAKSVSFSKYPYSYEVKE